MGIMPFIEVVEEVGHVLAPWEEYPYSLVSWWDMEKFSAERFFSIATTIEQLVSLEGQEQPINDPTAGTVVQYFSELAKDCEAIGLRLSAVQAQRIQGGVSDKTIKKHGEIKNMLPELRNRIHDELREKVFLYVPPERAKRYDLTEPFGGDVAKNFPSASFDSKEAGNCFASGRFTACVFHLMRVLEIGLIAFAKVFPTVPINKENWQQIIGKIESEIKEMPKATGKVQDWKEKQEKYSQLASNFMFFKDAWRNYTAHARGKYTEDEADAIYRNVCSFMKGLPALGLAE